MTKCNLKIAYNKTIAGASSVLAIVLICFSFIIPKIFADADDFENKLNGKGKTVYSMCKHIAGNSGTEIAQIFTDTNSKYGMLFRYCTGITGETTETGKKNYYRNLVADKDVKFPDGLADHIATQDPAGWHEANNEILTYALDNPVKYSYYCDQKEVENTVYTIYEDVLINTGDSSENNITVAFAAFITSLKAVASMLFMIRMISYVIQKIADGRDPLEEWALVLIKLGIGIAIIINAEKLVAALCYVGYWLGKELVNASSNSDMVASSAEELYNILTGSDYHLGLMEFIWHIIEIFLPFALSFLAEIAIDFAVLQVFLEIGIRRVFIYIPIAEIYQEGLRSPGIRYLKKLLAAILKLTLMYFVILLSGEISKLLASSSTNFLSLTLRLITIKAVTIGALFRTGEYANDILGV